MTTETAWVIEGTGDGSPTYWDGKDADSPFFTTDHTEAIRFARKEDAERAKYWLLPEVLRGVVASREHGWVKTPTPDAREPETR